MSAAVVNPLDGPEDHARGKELFHKNCAACHGNDGTGGHAPSLAKSNYKVGASDLALYKVLRDGIPGTAMAGFDFSIEQRWQLVGFLRSLDPQAGSRTRALDRTPPVDVSWQALLTARSRTDEWLTYSGAFDGWRHSPLREITPANVSGLKLRWAHQFGGEDAIQATPIVADGTIFISEPPSNVVALEAATGREIWRYVRRLPEKLPICCGRVNRGLAILGHRLFLGTLDARLVALDAHTGEVQWETEVAAPGDGFTITGAPLVVRDAVLIGVSGGEFAIRGFLAAYDAQTGELRWRFHTIPGPGEFGHDTWENAAWQTGGGPTWITGSFDPELNLVYWGVGNPAPVYDREARPGDNLFTNSVVALDATTGKLAWHFQFTPHDEHDWDFEPDAGACRPRDRRRPAQDHLLGEPQRLLLRAGPHQRTVPARRAVRGGQLGERSRRSWATDPDRSCDDQHHRDVDQAVGRRRHELAAAVLRPRVRHVSGACDAGLLDLYQGASDQVRRGPGGIYVGSGSATAEPAVNVVKALDAASGATRWEYVSPKQHQADLDVTYGGVLSTAGGVVFSASAGVVFALEAATGKELWRAGLGG